MNFRDVVAPRKHTALKLRIQEWLGRKTWSWLSLRLIWGQIEGFDLGCYTARYHLCLWSRFGWVEETHVPTGVGPEGLRRSWILFMTKGARDEFFEGLCK